MSVLLKLGGSVITEKDRADTLDGRALDDACDAIAEFYSSGSRNDRSDAIRDAAVEDLVVVHGGGSFGHHHASEHGVSTTDGTRDAGAALDVHAAMKTLNSFVLSRLHERDVPALPVHPLSAAARDAGGTLSLPTGQIETMLAEGFVPVLHGDVIAHEGAGATVVSGDELVTSIARALAPDRIGFCSTVPGVLDADGEVIPEIGSYDEVADVLGGSDATDVTGGMAAKVEGLLDLDAPAEIFGPEELRSFLGEERAGTRIDGR